MVRTPRPVLLVDDERAVRLNLAAYLEDEGFAVIEAESGEAALDVLRGERYRPTVAVVDLRLGGMDGNAFIALAGRLHPRMRFIVFTGMVGYLPPPEVVAAGVVEEDIFHKPLLDMAPLAAAVRRLMER